MMLTRKEYNRLGYDKSFTPYEKYQECYLSLIVLARKTKLKTIRKNICEKS